MTTWHRFADREELDRALADAVADSLRRDIAAHGMASAAFSGGSTPRGMLRALSRQQLDWSAVATSLVDERWVPADHPDSNARLLSETLLQGTAAASTFYPLFSDDCEPAAGAALAEQRLAALPRPFSAVVLGMGGDGHTASWFPQSANLADMVSAAQPARVMTTEPVTAPHTRITLTLPAVLDTRLLVLHLTGEDKLAVLERAIESRYPIAHILEQQQQTLHIYWAP